jgi:hypothetical protein
MPPSDDLHKPLILIFSGNSKIILHRMGYHKQGPALEVAHVEHDSADLEARMMPDRKLCAAP